MKKEKIIFIISLVMMLLATSISVYATSCLYNSSDVSYTAPSGSGLSANVQDSLTEVYGHCTDYTSMDTRVSSLEGHFLNNSTSYFDGNGTDEWLNIKKIDTGARGIKIFDASDVQRSRFYYHPGTDKTYVAAYNSTGTGGQGTLDLLGNPVMINGTNLSSLIIRKSFQSINYTIAANTSTTAIINIGNSGYTPIGIYHLQTNNGSLVKSDNYWLDGNNLKIYLTNTTTSTVSPVYVIVSVSYINNNFVNTSN